MPFCTLCWIVVVGLPEIHDHSSVHLRGAVVRCNDCSRVFSSKMARSRHRSAIGCSTPPISQFHCCECDKDFSTQGALTHHLGNQVIHPPRVVVALAPSAGYCEECKKTFATAMALDHHLASVIHNPIMQKMTCLGGKGCKKVFHTPSGMLSHLESGACASKITRDMIDDLVIAHDPTNVITDRVAVQKRAQDRMMIASSSMYSSSANDSVIFTPRGSSMSYGSSTARSNGTITPGYVYPEGSESNYDDLPRLVSPSSAPRGYPPTPPSGSSDSGSGAFQTPSDSSRGMFTPISGASLSNQLVANKFMCSLCPTSTKQYKDMGALHDHMRSKAHAAKIYHCPPATIMGSEHKSTGKKEKAFATLSGLSQHVEAGACDGGKATFNTAMSFVNEKLMNMGLGNLKLVKQ